MQDVTRLDYCWVRACKGFDAWLFLDDGSGVGFLRRTWAKGRGEWYVGSTFVRNQPLSSVQIWFIFTLIYLIRLNIPLQATLATSEFIADTDINFLSQYKMPVLFSGTVAMLESNWVASDPASDLPEAVEIIDIMLS